MTCLATAPTLFDRAFPPSFVEDEKGTPRIFEPVDLFDFLPDLSRSIRRRELIQAQEEDLERWDGQS